MKSISTRIAQVALFLATASLAFNTGAAPAVKIDGVRQNFPWSNAVEIGYSVTDCETGSANDYVLRFVVTKGGETTDITAAVGAPLVTNTAAGKVVWDAPADFASTPADVTLSVSVVDTPFDGDLSKLVGDYEVRDGQTLFGTLAGSYKLTIADGATVTLSNAVVTSLADDARFAGLTCLGDATIVLAGSDTNIVNGADNSPGIFVPTNHTLTIQGDGALVTTGGDYGAGIGSGQNSDCGNITISGGTVIANGGMAAAGIGSGYNGSTCGNVTISGGTVIATGGYEGAGIGSGFSDSVCGDITISGGTVIATGGKKSRRHRQRLRQQYLPRHHDLGWHGRSHRRRKSRRHRQRLRQQHLRRHHDLGWHGRSHRWRTGRRHRQRLQPPHLRRHHDRRGHRQGRRHGWW